MANPSRRETALITGLVLPGRRTIESAAYSSLTRRSFVSASAAAGVFDLVLLAAPSYAQTVPATDYLSGATGWLNSPPLTAAGLRGKVVLIDFWTYTCINWLRTLPYVRAWAEKYKDQGLVVIGVHAPEFAIREERRQRSPGREGHEGRLSDRDRQRLCDLARFQQPLLAGALFHRCAGTYSASSIRRGRIRAVGKDHSAIAGRGRSPAASVMNWSRSMPVAPKLPPIGAT